MSVFRRNHNHFLVILVALFVIIRITPIPFDINLNCIALSKYIETIGRVRQNSEWQVRCPGGTGSDFGGTECSDVMGVTEGKELHRQMYPGYWGRVYITSFLPTYFLRHTQLSK